MKRSFTTASLFTGLTLSVFSLLSCSNHSLYNSLQYQQQEKCLKILDDQQRQRCTEQAKMSFEEYEAKRQDRTSKSGT